MKVILSPRAEKEFRKLGKVAQMIVAKKIRGMVKQSPGLVEQLSGMKNLKRVRVGDYRIVYRQTKTEAYIVLIGHRRDIYKKLKELFG